MRLLGMDVFLPALVLGQATFGTITGTVTDSTGAVVPNTEVSVVNEGTQTVGGIPDRVGNGKRPSGQGTIDRWFDVTAFAVPAANAGLYKSFPVREKMYFRVSVSFTNLFNKANFDVPALNISAPNDRGSAGMVTSL